MSMTSLLEIRDLSTSFHTDQGEVPVLDKVSLKVGPGQTVALVGESGSGKSVTALSVLQLLESVSMQGEILLEGRNLLGAGDDLLRTIRGNRIAMIFQEPMTSLNPVYTIGDQLVEPLIVHQGLSKQDAEHRAIELLERTGIPDPVQRVGSYPHQLSGGQRQRAMIAMALACRPSLLIADEPTTALDVTIQAQILDLIRDVQHELGMAVLLITHDLGMVKKMAEHVYIMHKGRIVEEGVPEAIFSNPRQAYTRHLIRSVPKGESPTRELGKPLITVQDLRCHFPIKAGLLKKTVGMIKAVDGVELTIREGSTYGIVGESGSGKTTLGMAILRLTSGRGTIDYRGENLLSAKNSRMRHLRRELQVVFQDPYSSLSPRRTIGQIIGEGVEVHEPCMKRTDRLRLVEEALAEVGLDSQMAERYPHEFSGGQRQRIAIARAVVLRPRFIVLDEPTSALDMTIQAQIIVLLRNLQERHNITYLFISHDLRVVRAMADEIAVMKNGVIVESGPANRIFNEPSHPYTKALFAAAFELVASPAVTAS